MEKYLQNILYHGTDDFIGYMSKEEREDMKKKCFLAIETLMKIYNDNNFKALESSAEGKTKEITDILAYYIAADSALSNSIFYQYDDIYLTTSIKEAIKFAKDAYHYGEIGTIAWKLYEGLSTLNYQLPPLNQEQQEAFDSIIGFASHESEPIIYAFGRLPIENLFEENGRKEEFEDALDKETGTIPHKIRLNLRYKGSLDFTPGELVYKLPLSEAERWIKENPDKAF